MRGVVVRAAILALVCGVLPAQGGQAGTQSLGGISDSPIENDPAFQARRLRGLNEARQKAMVADAAKLVEVARALDAEVQAGGGEELTAAERAKLAQIEKLARHVKERMAESDADLVGPRPQFGPMPR